MSKTNPVATTPQLLASFATSLAGLGWTGISVRWERARKELRIEGPQGSASFAARAALYPSRALLDWVPEAERPGVIVVCPHIAAPLAADLRRAGLNHADLNGRFFVQAPWLHVDREPKDLAHRNPVTEPDFFSGRSSRLARLLLRPRDQGWTQEELVRKTELSRGLVSRLLASLVRQALVNREEGGRRVPLVFRVRSRDALLDQWKGVDSWAKRGVVRRFSVAADEARGIAEVARQGFPKEDLCFTLWFAAWLRHPYTTPPVVSAYVRHEELIETFQQRPVEAGGNLWLIAPREEEVFFDAQEKDGYRLVSDVQIYLDLLQMGQRGPDAAEALREWDGFGR